jgi:hypothetical protein
MNKKNQSMKILFKRIFILLTTQFIVSGCWCFTVQASVSETVYLQTDRTSYIAGETIFYKFYALDAATKKCSDISKVGYILLRTANSNPVLKVRIKIDKGLASGSITIPDTITSGVYQVLAFTSVMKNPESQPFFHKEIVIANRFDKELNFKLINSNSTDKSLPQLPIVTTDKAEYGLRQKVNLSIGKTNSKANVAVSVYEASNIVPDDKSIVETLNEQPDHSIASKGSSYYLPENKGKILRGRVIDEITHKSIGKAYVLLSCVDSVPNLEYATTDSTGMFQILLSDYYNGKELFLTVKDMPDDEHWKIVVEDEFSQSNKWNPALIPNNGSTNGFLIKSQNVVYINKSYQLNNEMFEPNVENNFIIPRMYYFPVKTVTMSDFVPLDDFPELVVELFPLIRVNKQKNNYHVRIIAIPSYLFSDTGPAIFLDGVYVDDVNKIIGLGSDKIKKIDAIYTERIFGDLIFQGVISLTSKTNEIVNTTPASYSLRLKNDNINRNKTFDPINPDTIQNKNTPFFKQLLYWNPNVELNSNDSTHLEFYTSDNAANFMIKVEGISEDGTPISTCSSIKVINQLNVTEK